MGRVEIKSETNIPCDLNNHPRGRLTSTLDFTLEDPGAIIRGPNFITGTNIRRPSNNRISEETINEAHIIQPVTNQNERSTVSPPEMLPNIFIGDPRATSFAITSEKKSGTFVCHPSLERFSGHTGVCRILGSKACSPDPYSLQLGDLIRFGSVGLVVCELNRGTSEDAVECLSEKDLSELKETYLSAPLGQVCTLGMDDSSSTSEETSEDEVEEEVEPFCYICYDEHDDDLSNPLVAPCQCRGDTKHIHLNCLHKWNSNNHEEVKNGERVCAVTNTDGLDVCSICKTIYSTRVKVKGGRMISLMSPKLEPPYITFSVVTQHEARTTQTALTNTRFQLSFKSLLSTPNAFLNIGRATTNHMVLRYRTVSHTHAKIQFYKGEFNIVDENSSNGTLLYLKKPLELPWGTVVNVKMGRTILGIKAKKRWRWQMASSATSAEHATTAANQVDERNEETSHELNSAVNRFSDLELREA